MAVKEKNRITLTINGKKLTTEAGRTILHACKEHGIFVPTLCHDERLEPHGTCRLCVVEMEGYEPFPACSTPAMEGMEIVTESENLTRIRRTLLSVILADHPNDCMCCESAGDCTLQELAYLYDVKPGERSRKGKALHVRDNNPFIVYDPNKCIRCGRCVDICRNVVMRDVVDSKGIGCTIKASTAFSNLTTSNCVFCGQCVSTCPTGALTEKQSMGKGRLNAVRKVRTTCTYCGTGCGFVLNVKNNEVIRVTSDYDAPVNRGNLCVKGRFGYEFIHSPERIKTPLIREGDGFREASWDEALDLVASKFTDLKEKYGSEAIGALSSARCTNEENFLLSKWVRTCFENNNVDNCARV
jgi:formate dehydrogenase alpha subunit